MQDKLFFNKLDDCYNLSIKYEKFRAIGFFDEFSLGDAISYCKKFYNNYYITFGGTNNSIRKMIGFNYNQISSENLSALKENFPINCICFNFLIPKGYDFKQLTHRDILGCLMAQNITRETIGDIILEQDNNRAFVFCLDKVVPVLLDISEIGRVKASASIFTDFDYLDNRTADFLDFKITVSSLRIDNVVAKMCNLSREQACVVLKDKNVLINGAICEKSTKLINENDVITIRKKGKFLIKDCSDLSKKGKYILQYQKYN